MQASLTWQMRKQYPSFSWRYTDSANSKNIFTSHRKPNIWQQAEWHPRDEQLSFYSATLHRTARLQRGFIKLLVLFKWNLSEFKWKHSSVSLHFICKPFDAQLMVIILQVLIFQFGCLRMEHCSYWMKGSPAPYFFSVPETYWEFWVNFATQIAYMASKCKSCFILNVTEKITLQFHSSRYFANADILFPISPIGVHGTPQITSVYAVIQIHLFSYTFLPLQKCSL